MHHIVTNDPEKDPDVQHLPMFAISEDFLHNVYSTYHKRILTIDSIAKLLLRSPAYLFLNSFSHTLACIFTYSLSLKQISASDLLSSVNDGEVEFVCFVI